MNINITNQDAGNQQVPSVSKNIGTNMTISDSSQNEKNFHALLIRVRIKLPQPIKAQLKTLGSFWYEAYQGYVTQLVNRNAIETLLAPWSCHITLSEVPIDPTAFAPTEIARNNRDMRIGILQEQINQESAALMCDIGAYDSGMSEFDFDNEPSREGKTSEQVRKEIHFYERRQEILVKREQLEALSASSTGATVDEESFVVDETGLWHVSENGRTWISSPLQVTARVRDEHGLNHGKLIEFDDADHVHHSWDMPMKMLAGDCSEFRSTLMNMGLEISTHQRARQFLADYVQRSHPTCTARCVHRTGWYKAGFILPDT